MKIALAQMNPTVGDITGNAQMLIEQIEQARSEGVHLIITPEMFVLGYPPKDLLLRKNLIQKNIEAVEKIATHCKNITAIVGCVLRDPNNSGKGIFNAAAVCRDGKVVASYHKMLLPTYDVFDETRYFNAGSDAQIVEIPTDREPMRVGITICEDLWNDEQFAGRRVYGDDPIARTVEAGAQLIINISGSPYRVGIKHKRENLFIHQVKKHHVPLIYVNQIGGNDDLLFDGASLVIGGDGNILARAKPFEPDLLIMDFDVSDPQSERTDQIEAYPNDLESIRSALVLGIRDYLSKCGFEKVVLGLSGGIDSALTAALAVEALGSDRVHGVAMPSRYSSNHSLEDAKQLADNLGISFSVMNIEDSHRSIEKTVKVHFKDQPRGTAEENIQARIRGNLLMALSNKFGWLLLTTGNKSELAVGYCTLYGDMCGGLAVLSDVPKTTVYELARLINSSTDREVIPLRTIKKAPSAELREDQTDQDTLPPYDVLDAILEHYVSADRSVDEIVAEGFDRATVERISHMVDLNEYKRKQAPVGLKVTSRAFGTGRRMPIAAKY